ncbi:MAG TPA: efflux RND transporter permease subunit [Candidatus Binatia bacterium]|jgi:HAE1 family hydrophobic/amphiphilic exporter-1
MTLSDFCIRRPVFTILLMAAVLVGGLAGYRTLAVSALPKVDFPTIQVSATLSGASPETMASAIATPLERQFSTIAGITSMTSTSFIGRTDITIQFDLDRSLDGAALDVQSAISATLRRLPPQMTSPPSFQKVNPADQPVYFVALSSDTLPLSAVNEIADTILAERISTLSGVAQVIIFGTQKYAVRIRADANRLLSMGLSYDELRSAIAAAASNAPVGLISGHKQAFNIDISDSPKDAATFSDIIVAWRNGAPLRLRDVAVVTDSVEDDRSIGRMNGLPAIVIAIQRQPDANTIAVVREVQDLLERVRGEVPASIKMTSLLDRSVSIEHAVHDVERTLLLTIGLVVLVIYAFLRDLRATLISAIAVPLCIVGTWAGMAWLQFSINNVSLLALTLCVGFVVDDAIVMLENVVRHMEGGLSAMEASLRGAREIQFTILSITFSLVAVFIPILFMGGVVGRIFHEFAVTISMAILISAFVALTLTPMMCSRVLKSAPEDSAHGHAAASVGSFQALTRFYARTLDWTLHHRRIMLGVTFLTLGASVWSFMTVPKGFFPLEDIGFIFGQAEAAQDVSFDAMVAKLQRVSDIVNADPAVDSIFFGIGGGRGATNAARMFMSLKPADQRDSIFTVMGRIRAATREVEGLNIFLQPVQNLSVGTRLTKSLYQYTLQSSDFPQLSVWSEKMQEAMAADPRFRDVTSDLQLKSLKAIVDIDRAKAASLGVTDDDVRRALYASFGDAQIATLFTPSNQYAVILERTVGRDPTPEDIENTPIKGEGPTSISLSSLATVQRAIGPLSVNHQGQMPAVTISFDLAGGAALSDAVTGIDQISRRLEIPETITGGFAGSAQVFEDSARGQGTLIVLAIIVIYIILGMLYESFIHPITILSGLPSAGIGAVVALRVMGMDLSVIAFVGVIMLIGIVKKNAIMMVDFAISARAEGQDAFGAIRAACLLRFRPIMMTTMAAMFGTLPIALGIGSGAELRQPLGVAVVGGLIVSQVLTLYITPVVYLYLERWSSSRRTAVPVVP